MKLYIDLFVIFIYKPKNIIILNEMLPLELWTLWKLINVKFIKKMYKCKMSFNGLKYIKMFYLSYETCWHLGDLRQFAIMICSSKKQILI